ncbi:MAG: class I SAM-dependent methyltransferase [Verrucomicrobiota bacterium]|nr:class I SAM-dependent methyltransferase [Verrucomicrobiota bacterium]
MIAAIKRFLPKYLFALSVSPILFTVGVFSRRHRFLIFQIAKHFGMSMPTEKERLPTIALADVLPRKLGLTLLEPLAEGGNVSMLEVMVIAATARNSEPPSAFEIGTFDGRTALNIAANLKEGGRVWTLDLPKTGLGQTEFELAPGESAFVDKKESGTKFKGTAYSNQITQLYGDSATFDFSPFAEKMGLVFVDGSHAYEYVLKDTVNALRLAAAGGTILWHDYQQDWPGVIRALNELQQNDSACANLRRIEGTSLVMLKRESPRRTT